MSTLSTVETFLDRAERAIKRVDSAAFLVLPRVLRRVIKQEFELPTLTLRVPHRKSYVISGRTLAQHVEHDELGLTEMDVIPEEAILISRPEEKELKQHSDEYLMCSLWRLLFHARIHQALEHQLSSRTSGRLTPADIRHRIDLIGQVAFDEIHAVLGREHFLLPGATQVDVYTEFAAVYAELRFFSPEWLPNYFPSLRDYDHVDAVLARDLDLPALFEQTRLEHGLDPRAVTASIEDETRVAESDDSLIVREPSAKLYNRLLARAERAMGRGNSIGAAILSLRADRYAPAAVHADAYRGMNAAVDEFIDRLQAALDFDESAARDWRNSVIGLLGHCTRGFWNADKRLLYDLQKVCVDHERDIYRVDLLAWIRSRGQQPLKRSLPNQREVLMTKHLRSAMRRLVTARLSGDERAQLAQLLNAAAASAERQMRRHLRPQIVEALQDVELVPANVAEQVAWDKLIDELLDTVVDRGFLTMGTLRDALSRSNIKLADLSGPRELWHGDRLLKADRRLGEQLDGVHHRGEFYMRWLQGMSSLAFGNRLGRFITQFIVIPFGGAYVALKGLLHIVHLLSGHPESETGGGTAWFPYAEGLLGLFLMGLLHLPPFRALVLESISGLWKSLRYLCVEMPRWLLYQPRIREFLRSPEVQLVRRFFVSPLLATLFVCFLIPWLFGAPATSISWTIVVFLSFNLMFNSRMGRDCEEVAAEWVSNLWDRIRVGVFVALFELVMDSFKWLLESFERVLYAVDEWLRFRSGESRLSLFIKAPLGLFWAFFTFVSRFCVNLLIEPQINPIKHFPVVTVSHKIIVPLGLPGGPLSKLLMPIVGSVDVANAIAGTTVFLIPGIFGFLVWELQSNWKLYAANRPQSLKPVLVGSHGETLIRLMKPGFHSGTLPKLYGKLRRAERKGSRGQATLSKSRYEAQLHHLEVAVRHFVDRELLNLLHQIPAWRAYGLRTGHIELASNSIRIEIQSTQLPSAPLLLAFQEQSGWLVASILEVGWVPHLAAHRREDLIAALAGIYQIGGVDLVREQIEACFLPDVPPYDVTEAGLTVWPDGEFLVTVHYNLRRRPTIRPTPLAAARKYGLPTLESERLIFGQSTISWNHWVSIWDTRARDANASLLFSFPTRLIRESRHRTPVAPEEAPAPPPQGMPGPAPRRTRQRQG